MARVAQFIILFSLLIIGFQNCAQDEVLAPSQISEWNATPVPVLAKENDQCITPTPSSPYSNSATCPSGSVTYSLSQMPLDNSGNKIPLEITVPLGCKFMIVELWGAGGGATSPFIPRVGNNQLRGGDGAYVNGTIPVGQGEILKVIIGEGGSAGGLSTFGGGGSSGQIGGTSTGGASGGGRTAIVRGHFDIVTAGGGGGSSAYSHGGNAGLTITAGGSISISSSMTYTGGGIATNGEFTQIASGGIGGIGAGTLGSGSSGSRAKGGDGGVGNPGSGGGGGGYFGGGGGASSGEQNPPSTFASATGGGGGGSYIGCGNLTLTTKTADSNCEYPSRGGGTAFAGSNSAMGSNFYYCAGQLPGNNGQAIISWK